MRLIFILACLCVVQSASAQKMLLLERANRAKTTKLYIGDQLKFRLNGPENYWYSRRIEDIFPEKKSLKLDNYLVHVDSISHLRLPARPVPRIIGGTLFTFGSSLLFALGVARIYNEGNVNYPPLLATAGGSLGLGFLLAKPRKLHMGKKYRLRPIEIKFPAPLIPPPPGG